MLRLPSAAVRGRWQPEQPCEDRATSSTFAGEEPEAEDQDAANIGGICGESGPHDRKRRNSLVNRSQFFIEHEVGADFKDVYEVEEAPLGQGGFGTVWRARMRQASTVTRAIKAVKKQSAATDVMVQAEIAILRSLDHPYICHLFETFEGPKFTYLVMELVDGQELFDYVQQASCDANLLSEDFAAHIMWQVFSALQYCHGRSVVHRDLKPENIMVHPVARGGVEEQLEIKLIDFGLASCWTGTSRPANGSLIGTYCYAAPEALNGNSANPSSDMWSAGMVLHTLLVGGLPDEAVCNGREQLVLSDGAYVEVSAPAQELLAGLLRSKPEARLTATQAAACAWLQAEARAVPSQERLAKTMKAFTCFYRSNMLRRAFLTALAMQLADQQIVDLQEQFLSMDVDHNGKISRAEMAASLERECPGYDGDISSWIGSVFESIDTDGSDEIEYTEWLAAAHQEGEVRSTEAIHAAFRVFDVDGSGKISMNEIARITVDNTADIAEFLPEYDLNGDGEIDIEEFRDLILRAPPLCPPAVSSDSLQGEQSRPRSAPASRSPAAALSRMLGAGAIKRQASSRLPGGGRAPAGGGSAQGRATLWRSEPSPPTPIIVSM